MKKVFNLVFAFLVVALVATALFPQGAGIVEFTGVGLSVTALSLALPQTRLIAMETITIDAARGAFTNAVVAVYNERTTPTAFLRSFFPNVISRTKLVSIDVKRGTEKIAVDVLRGTGANMNSKKRSTLKTLQPPLYKEGFNVNELDIYDTAFATLDPGLMANLATEAAEELLEVRNKIDRAYEKQCADVLVTGVITLANGDNIDFKRKAASLVDDGTDWLDNTVDPVLALQAGGRFIREVGKSQGGTYNVIMGGDALNAMINNTIFKSKYDLKNITNGEIREPQRNALGASLHGRVSAGSYSFNVWTYPEGYETANGTFTYYIPNDVIIILPEVTSFKTVFGLVPQLPGMTPMTSTQAGAYILHEYLDEREVNHTQEVHSAGVSIPVAIDQIYTAKVVQPS
jgi:hypothetical protein